MKRRFPLAIAGVLIAAGLGAVSSRACGPLHEWKQPVGGIFRSARQAQGEWVWTTGVWQAKGANTDGLTRQDYYKAFDPTGDQPTHIPRDLYLAATYDLFGAHRMTHNGDYQLPVDPARYPEGTGEVSEIRVAADATNLYLRLLWNSMPRADAQIATVTFSAQHAAPLPHEWPAGAALLGRYDAALTLSGRGGSLDGHRVSTRIDLKDHTTEAVIPRGLLPKGPLSIDGGSGLANPSDPASYWKVATGPATPTSPGTGSLPATTNVWELFFAGNSPWTFDELEQATQLSRGRSDSSQLVNVDALANDTSSAPGVRTGDFSVMFASRFGGADGIVKAKDGLAPLGPDQLPQLPLQTTGFDESWYYTGRLQMYSMHVPKSVTASSPPRPLVVYLHGFTGNTEEPFRNPVGLVDAVDKKGWLLASALGRGDGFYAGIHDLDVTEVIRDVSAHYRVDPNRIYLMGHSMGGYGTDNVSVRHPDLFAAVAPAEGTGSPELALNLRNVPWFVMTADEDLDTGAKNALAFYDSLSAQGLDATALEYRMKIHEYSSIYDTIPRLMAFFASHVRNPSPAIVTYIKDPHDAQPALGLTYDGAYWVSGLSEWNHDAASRIDAESSAIPHTLPAVQIAKATRIDTMVDEGGPTGRTIAQLHQTVPGFGALAPVARRIELTATNLRSATIDLDRAGIPSTGISMRLIVHSASPLTVTLTNGDKRMVLRLKAGTSSLKLIP